MSANTIVLICSTGLLLLGLRANLSELWYLLLTVISVWSFATFMARYKFHTNLVPEERKLFGRSLTRDSPVILIFVPIIYCISLKIDQLTAAGSNWLYVYLTVAIRRKSRRRTGNRAVHTLCTKTNCPARLISS